MFSLVTMRLGLAFGALGVMCGGVLAAETNRFVFTPRPEAVEAFGGFVDERMRVNVEHWLLPAPLVNPGLLGMFELRDREPRPNLVPWAGEFVGKYLISAIQAMRTSNDGRLAGTVTQVMNGLIRSQAEDGYLGPFRKEERLRGQWDLWGHYHCMLALLMWHEERGDTNALAAARKAADLVCNTYLDTGRRAIDAGSDEMNLAIIHALGWIYRVTKEERYLRMMREIEKDWERGGDYLRAGLAGTEFFQSRRPRWESLHNIQALVELYRITGEGKYRDAFEHHWRSIARWDLRNTGGFSSGEQATGNPYAPTAIETCCTIAWMALSLDMLALTGEARAADLLELATFNAWAGAQHPSGHWCTYNTPMDGAREASAHSIVFQARAGTPELNCCSVNGPRGWGMLSDWAFMRSADGYVVNWLAPGTFVFSDSNAPNSAVPTRATNGSYGPLGFASAAPDPNRRRRILFVQGNYPVESTVTMHMELDYEEEFTLRVRIPEWSRGTRAWLNDRELERPRAGEYLTLRRKWQSHWRKPDTIRLELDFTPRAVPGAKEATGSISVYRGPLLLAADQRHNAFDEIPAIDPAALVGMQVLPGATNETLWKSLEPLLLTRVRAADGRAVTLCDFASAGAMGTRYRTWLPATKAAPSPVVTRVPRDSATIASGMVLFRWTRPGPVDAIHLEISKDPLFASVPIHSQAVTNREALVKIDPALAQYEWCYWRVVTRNEFGETFSSAPYARFRVDGSLPRVAETLPPARTVDADGNIVTMAEPLSFDESEKRLFEIGEWPEENYSVKIRFRLRSFPTNRIAQIFSAWAAPMDDPLRITIENGKLSARIEAGANYATPAAPIELNRWHEVSVTKAGSKLTLVLDGKERASCTVPEFMSTRARDFALGGNPHFPGNEFIDGEVQTLSFQGD
jgi:uncharacterized protein